MMQAKKLCESLVSTVRKDLKQFTAPLNYRAVAPPQAAPPPTAPPPLGGGGAYNCTVCYVIVDNEQCVSVCVLCVCLSDVCVYVCVCLLSIMIFTTLCCVVKS